VGGGWFKKKKVPIGRVMSKAQKGNKERKKPKADKNQPKTQQIQAKPSFNPFARKT